LWGPLVIGTDFFSFLPLAEQDGDFLSPYAAQHRSSARGWRQATPLLHALLSAARLAVHRSLVNNASARSFSSLRPRQPEPHLTTSPSRAQAAAVAVPGILRVHCRSKRRRPCEQPTRWCCAPPTAVGAPSRPPASASTAARPRRWSYRCRRASSSQGAATGAPLSGDDPCTISLRRSQPLLLALAADSLFP
jgi:hypothetical protein